MDESTIQDSATVKVGEPNAPEVTPTETEVAEEAAEVAEEAAEVAEDAAEVAGIPAGTNPDGSSRF